MGMPRRTVCLLVIIAGPALLGCQREEAAESTQIAVDKENEVQVRVITIPQARYRQANAIRIQLDVPEDNTDEVVIYIGDQEKRLDGFDELEEILIALRKKGLSKSYPVLISPHPEVRHK
ncbi:MAG: hypothetical protein QF662_02895 [Phycisphaerae bacterium]|jgi:hypothetical protein|nr:hypothetical protein [Phycisphaerae bacterium]